MWVRLFAKLLLNPINIPLHRFAFATRCCPPSKGRAVKFSSAWQFKFPSWTGGDRGG